ncbi:uncharacterized protein LOC116604282 [Nematostella vectensis]|uniref:uncharacterized protein LOC116604282 n=1 Tax=Nematostella vectensis TaxID=45351 RepID=UPI0013905BAE|nr:uncharacterized protein LOC116604282 [Nematostella vectensis]
MSPSTIFAQFGMVLVWLTCTGHSAPVMRDSSTAFLVSSPSCHVFNVLRVDSPGGARRRLSFSGHTFTQQSKFLIKKYIGANQRVQLSIHWASDPKFLLTVVGSDIVLKDSSGIVGVSNLFEEGPGIGGLVTLRSLDTASIRYIYGDLSGNISLGTCHRSPYAQLRICLNEQNCDV